jgi:hypothetical protein
MKAALIAAAAPVWKRGGWLGWMAGQGNGNASGRWAVQADDRVERVTVANGFLPVNLEPDLAKSH